MPPTHIAPQRLPGKGGARTVGLANGFAGDNNGDDAGDESDIGQLDALIAPLSIDEPGNADRRKDEFLATVCHELRNPIGAIQNAVKVLRGQNDNKVATDHMHELIERQVRQMSFLVAGLLDVTSIVRGRLALQCERVDLVTVLRNAVETLEWDLRGRSHQLTLALPESSVWLAGDGARLEQLFVNLLGNASKYTQVGGEIALSLDILGASAIVRVRDSGIGISSDVLPHVFNLFMQAETQRRARARVWYWACPGARGGGIAWGQRDGDERRSG
jgi:signal transduction histidine kinase